MGYAKGRLGEALDVPTCPPQRQKTTPDLELAQSSTPLIHVNGRDTKGKTLGEGWEKLPSTFCSGRSKQQDTAVPPLEDLPAIFWVIFSSAFGSKLSWACPKHVKGRAALDLTSRVPCGAHLFSECPFLGYSLLRCHVPSTLELYLTSWLTSGTFLLPTWLSL